MFITTIFIITPKGKPLKCLSTDELMENLWYVYTIDTIHQYKERKYWYMLQGKPWKHYSKKPATKHHILSDSFYMKYPEYKNS